MLLLPFPPTPQAALGRRGTGLIFVPDRTSRTSLLGPDPRASPETSLKGSSSIQASMRSLGSNAPLHNDSVLEQQVGGRLAFFAHQWTRTSTDAWVQRIVSQGYSLEFLSRPPDRFLSSPLSRNIRKQALMLKAIRHLLDIRAIELVPPEEAGHGVYSILFLVPKKTTEWRAILDLKFVNCFLKGRHFRMETLRSILMALQEGDYLASIDLKEAYLHVPIHPLDRRFLRFAYAGVHYQYRALPFGLSTAPRVFTKIMVALVAHLRTRGIHLYPFLDDLLIRSPSWDKGLLDIRETLAVLASHGFLVNRKKSSLVPSNVIQHLGTIIDVSGDGPSHRRKETKVACHLLQAAGSNSGTNSVSLPLTGPDGFHDRDCALGAFLFSSSTVAPPTPSGTHHEQVETQGVPDFSRSSVPQVVDVPGSPQGGEFPAGRPGHGDDRRKSLRMGRSLRPSGGSGSVVRRRALPIHQLVGAPGDSASPGSIPSRDSGSARARAHRQCHRQGTSQSSGGNKVLALNVRSRDSVALGRKEPGLIGGRSYQWGGQLGGRLAKPVSAGSGGMDPGRSSVQGDCPPVRGSPSRPLCTSSQLQGAQIFLQVSISGGRGGGCSDVPLAAGSALCFPTLCGVIPDGAEDQIPESRSHPCGSALATAAVVFGPGRPLDRTPSTSGNSSASSPPGFCPSSKPSVAQSSRLEIERDSLARCGYPVAVQDTILASRRPSTARIYQSTWQAYTQWCLASGGDPLAPSATQVLGFLQMGLDKGLRPNTLRRQVFAISSVLGVPGVPSVAAHPHVQRFLKGAAALKPPPIHRFPTWDLNLVLGPSQRHHSNLCALFLYGF
ncbi:uncharacterized protein LOC128344105 [Hemicordylus capensis]|uniref:uncharacterized protein LOC128344105 n=1 Tax=Hemicordylus capensis TaxID=884348 RepID=UPI002302B5A7|nr:uncharacterized protein LOC128344105 [Hemicordylus capensis]XP_053149583.1 uncharacterized protein LOC128344105 [Hemicordylus capensis]